MGASVGNWVLQSILGGLLALPGQFLAAYGWPGVAVLAGASVLAFKILKKSAKPILAAGVLGLAALAAWWFWPAKKPASDFISQKAAYSLPPLPNTPPLIEYRPPVPPPLPPDRLVVPSVALPPLVPKLPPPVHKPAQVHPRHTESQSKAVMSHSTPLLAHRVPERPNGPLPPPVPKPPGPGSPGQANSKAVMPHSAQLPAHREDVPVPPSIPEARNVTPRPAAPPKPELPPAQPKTTAQAPPKSRQTQPSLLGGSIAEPLGRASGVIPRPSSLPKRESSPALPETSEFLLPKNSLAYWEHYSNSVAPKREHHYILPEPQYRMPQAPMMGGMMMHPMEFHPGFMGGMHMGGMETHPMGMGHMGGGHR